MTSDEDRIAYLAGDGEASLDPEDRADLDELRELLADPALWADPDPSLEDRVVSAVVAEASKADRTPPATPPLPNRRERRLERAGAESQRRRRRRYAVVGAAAAAALVVALGVSALDKSTSTPRYAAALAPTDLARGASGTAKLTRTTAGWRIELHSSGLPRLDNGRYYEAWMANGAGVLVPIGTFNEGPVVTLWSGVSPSDYPTITVTQQSSGDVASSGKRVLAGTATAP